MNAPRTLLAAVFGSALLLLAAFAFQHLGGMAPCKLCIWQRYPHAIAIAAGAIALVWPAKALIVVGAISMIGTTIVAFYHVGVEQRWWEGPSTCSSAPVGSLSADDLMSQIMSAPLVRCDEIPWELFSISMAGWNGIASLSLLALWISSFRAS